MTDEVISWLLEDNNPSVRYHTLTSLLGRSPDDPAVKAARASIMKNGIVPEILDRQNPDGSWAAPDRFYTDKYRGSVWTLLILAELAADPADQRLKNACEFILGHAQDPADAGFSLKSSAKTGTGLSSYVIPCLTGNMAFSLIKLGYLEDSRVGRAIDWIVRWQRADDADGPAPAGGIYDRFEMCFGRHSCHMGAAKAMKALAAIPPDRRSREVSAKLDELAEYFLKHHIYKKSHDLGKISRPGWLKPGFPLMYQTDILELLEILVAIGVNDPRMQEASEIVLSKQQADGKWLLENSNNGKMLVDIEVAGQPSKWLTLRALHILHGLGAGSTAKSG